MFQKIKSFFSSRDDAITAVSSHDEAKKISSEIGNAVAKKAAVELIAKEDFIGAIAAYRTALSHNAKDSGALIGLGYALMESGQDQAALAELKNSVVVSPLNVDAHYMIGVISQRLGDIDAAIMSLRRAISMDTSFERAYTDLVRILYQNGMVNEAAQVVEQGLVRLPESLNLTYYAGNMSLSNGQFDMAISHYSKVLVHAPGYLEVLSNMGIAFKNQGDLAAAIASFRKVLAVDPLNVDAFSNLLLTMQYSEKYARAEVFQEHLRFAETFEWPLKKSWRPYQNTRDSARRLRIGYVSADFCNHTAAYLTAPVLQNHDKANFEIFIYYNKAAHDDMTAQFVVMADHWRDCAGVADEVLAETIRTDQIDILIDVSGHTAGNRLLTFARKPAPIQASWLGYMGTTGLSAMDYRITDFSSDPIGTTEQYHSEKLLRLVSMAQFQPAPTSPSVNSLPALSSSHFTFGCLNNLAKITPEVVRVWARILTALPRARLLLGNVTGDDTRRRLAMMFFQEGIAEDKLLFREKMPMVDYLALHHEIDLGLDTFPYNGGTTTFHSLWMGVPVVALEGNTPVSRAGVSIMAGAGYPEFGATSEEQYIQKALEFAQDLPRLNQIRASLRDQATVLFGNDPDFVTRPLEALYRKIWTEWCALN